MPYPTPTTCGASGAFGGKNAGRGGGAVIAGPLGTAGAATAWGASILALGFTSSKKIISEHRAEMYVYIDVRVCIYIYISTYVILHIYMYVCVYIYIRTLKHDMSHMMVDFGKSNINIRIAKWVSSARGQLE